MNPVVKLRAPVVLLLAGLAAPPIGAVPDGVSISTMVTDRAGKPVTGLTLKDFELRDDGVVQKLLAVEARRAEPRRIAILLDEFHVQASDTARVRDAVIRFVNERLRTDDTAVVLKPLDSLTTIRLTADRGRISGGGARSALWTQIVASVLALPLERTAVEEGSAYGAALLGGVACGAFADVHEAVAACVRVRETVEPDPAWVETYAAGYERFRTLYPALRPLERG